MAITYTYAQENRGKKITFYVITMDAKYLPYAILVLTLVMSSPEAAMRDAIGLVAAHLYDFLTVYWPQFGRGFNVIQTPRFMTQWFANNGGRKNVTVKNYGIAYQPRSMGSSWSSRGQGRRLGGGD